jgi:hypothetical protein
MAGRPFVFFNDPATLPALRHTSQDFEAETRAGCGA